MFSYCCADVAGSLEGRWHGCWVCIPLGAAINQGHTAEKVLEDELSLAAKLPSSQKRWELCLLLMLRAVDGIPFCILDMCLWEREGAECLTACPNCSVSTVWKSFWVLLSRLLVSPDTLHGPRRGWHRAIPAAVCPLWAGAVFVWSLRSGGKRTGNDARCTLHAYLTAALHSSAFQEERLHYLPFPGLSGAVQKLFTRCQLRAGRRLRTGCVKEPPLLGGKMNFMSDEIEEDFWGLGGFEVISEFCAQLPRKHLLRTWAHSAFPRPYGVWIPDGVVQFMGSSQWHKQQLPVNLMFIPLYPLPVCLILRCSREREAAEGYICCGGTSRYFKGNASLLLHLKGCA